MNFELIMAFLFAIGAVLYALLQRETLFQRTSSRDLVVIAWFGVEIGATLAFLYMGTRH